MKKQNYIIWILIFLILAIPGQLEAQVIVLQFQVVKRQGQEWETVGNVPVFFTEPEIRTPTNPKGLIDLKLPGHLYTVGSILHVTVELEGYIILHPEVGMVKIPQPETAGRFPTIKIYLHPRGSNDEISDPLMDRLLRAVIDNKRLSALSRGKPIENVLDDFILLNGLSTTALEKIQAKLDQWEKDNSPFHQLAALELKTPLQNVLRRRRGESYNPGGPDISPLYYVDRPYASRQELFLHAHRHAVPVKLQATAKDQVVYLRLTGDLHFGNLEFDKALKAYEQALGLLSKEDSPREWASLQNDIGATYREIASRAQGELIQTSLSKAEDSHKQALSIYSEKWTPVDWAKTQQYLGSAFWEHGKRTEADLSKQLFKDAIQAQVAALRVFTREKYPEEWAFCQDMLGLTLAELGRRENQGESITLIKNAIENLKEALKIYDEKHSPQDRARTQNNIGALLSDLAARSEGNESSELLSSATKAHLEALRIYSPQFEDSPQDWARTQIDLGQIYMKLGTRVAGKDSSRSLEDSENAFRQAMRIFSREKAPQQWALCQDFLGIVLHERGARSAGPDSSRFLKEAVDAYDNALMVYTREQLPQDWARTQNNRGTVLRELAVLSKGSTRREYLEEALEAHNLALKVFRRNDFPQEWARTQEKLGLVYHWQAVGVAGIGKKSLFENAGAAYFDSLTVYSRQQFPQDWARIKTNLGIVLAGQARLASESESRQRLGDAQKAFTESLEVYTRAEFPQDWANTQSHLGDAILAVSRHLPDDKSVAYIDNAIECYNKALEIFTVEQFPRQWANNTANLGSALIEKSRRAQILFGRQEALEKGIKAFRDALNVYNKDQFPTQWADAQINLGWGLITQGTTTISTVDSKKSLEEAVDAIEQVFTVLTPEHNPASWAFAQWHIGAAQFWIGVLYEPDNKRLFQEAENHSREALKIYVPDQFPDEWAQIQRLIGNVLAAQAKSAEGAAKENLLEASFKAYDQALTIHTSGNYPKAWVDIQMGRADAFSIAKNFEQAHACYQEILNLDPDNLSAYSELIVLYQDELGEFDQAFEFTRQWLERHPDNLAAQVNFAEAHFTTGRFAEAERMFARLLSHPDMDAGERIAIQTLEIATLVAQDKQGSTASKLEMLEVTVSEQSEHFVFGYTFKGVKRFIRKEERLAPQRIWLISLIEAVEQKVKSKILAALKVVRNQFLLSGPKASAETSRDLLVQHSVVGTDRYIPAYHL